MAEGERVPKELNGRMMIGNAAEHVRAKMGLESCDMALVRVRKGEVEAYQHFRYALGKEVAAVLGLLARGSVKEAYLFFENRCDTFPGEPLCLGVRVDKKSAAVVSLTQSLSEAVTSALSESVIRLFDSKPFMHIEIFDDDDVQRQIGVAAAMGSFYEPPLQIWP